MTTNDQVRDEKLQYDTDREQQHQQQIIEQAKFTYSPLEKAFKKQIQTVEGRR